MTRALSPEERFLILCARLELTGEAPRTLGDLLQGGLHWDSLLKDGATFGLLPLLHRHLTSTASRAAVPTTVLQALDEAYQRQSMRSLRIFETLRRVQAALAEAKLPALLLKGAFLAPWLYGDTALRPMSDLDLLIRPQDAPAVCAALISLGFHGEREDASGIYNNQTDLEVGQKLGHLPALYLDRVCRVELHLAILQDAAPLENTVMAEVWAAREEGDSFFLTPPLEYLFLYLAAHLDKHVFMDGTAQLYWFCDLHELVLRTGQSLDWVRLNRLAAALGKEQALRRALGWLQEHWGTPIPAGLPAGGGLPLARILHNGRRFYADPDRKPIQFRTWQRLAQVRHARGWQAKAAFLGALLIPSPAKIKDRYHPQTRAAWCFWYLAHPFVLAARALRSLARHVQQSLHS